MISIAYNRLPLINPDGIYGRKTAEAVKLFQNEQSLLPTGEVDFKTWKRLMQKAQEAEQAILPPKNIVPIADFDLPLKFGDENGYVEVLQKLLNLALKSIKGFEALEEDGSFKSKTQEATRCWQRICRFEETGIVDKKTWNSLVEYQRAAGTR